MFFCIVTFISTFIEGFGTPEYRRFRGLLFMALGISTGFPMLHPFFFPFPIEGRIPTMHMGNWLLGGLSYIIGVIIYIFRFPEKIWPGRFCFLGSSHQLWHCFILIAICFHYFASLDSYYDRIQYPCTA